MTKKLQISVPSPCHENWAAMTPVKKDRFCGSCQKVVHDFTRSSDREIGSVLSKQKNACGRFLHSQLDRNLVVQQKNHWLPAGAWIISFLALGSNEMSAQKTNVLVENHEVRKDKSAKGDLEIISGHVNDEMSLSIPGVNIVNLNSKVVTNTDRNGGFSISVKIGDRLEFSMPGMVKRVMTIDDFQSLMIVLSDSEDGIVVERCNELRRGTAITGAVMTIESVEIIRQRTFFGRIFHSIGNLVR